MIYGKTVERRIEDEQTEIRDSILNGKRRFAFLPLRLVDGRKIVFHFYWEYRNGYRSATTGTWWSDPHRIIRLKRSDPERTYREVSDRIDYRHLV